MQKEFVKEAVGNTKPLGAKVNKRDRELIERYRNGELEVFAELMEPYIPKLEKLIEKRLRKFNLGRNCNKSDVEDLLQESLINVYRGLNQFKGGSAFYTWLYRIAANKCNHFYASEEKRKNQINGDMDDCSMQEAEHGEPCDSLGGFLYTLMPEHFYELGPDFACQYEECREAFNYALNRLERNDPLQAKAFVMFQLSAETYTYEDLAKIFGIPKGTVRSRMFHARKKLTSYMEDRQGRDGEDMSRYVLRTLNSEQRALDNVGWHNA